MLFFVGNVSLFWMVVHITCRDGSCVTMMFRCGWVAPHGAERAGREPCSRAHAPLAEPAPPLVAGSGATLCKKAKKFLKILA